MHVKFNIYLNECIYCKNGIETREHFFLCLESFWFVLGEKIYHRISEHSLSLSALTYNNVRFSIILEDSKLV